jgi:hypothetical protein
MVEKYTQRCTYDRTCISLISSNIHMHVLQFIRIKWYKCTSCCMVGTKLLKNLATRRPEQENRGRRDDGRSVRTSVGSAAATEREHGPLGARPSHVHGLTTGRAHEEVPHPFCALFSFSRKTTKTSDFHHHDAATKWTWGIPES